MEDVRIAILDNNDEILCFMDNSIDAALPYFSEELHEYLKGSASTFTFKTEARHPDAALIVDGCKVSFRYKEKDYYFNITSISRDENEVECDCWSLNFELLNEVREAYTSETEMTFSEYFNDFNWESTIKFGINELVGIKKQGEFQGDQTLLARLFSLADLFDAEFEFVTKLTDNYALDSITLNVYKKRSLNDKGVGDPNRTIIRYGNEIVGVKKTSDISDLYTCILATGNTTETTTTETTTITKNSAGAIIKTVVKTTKKSTDLTEVKTVTTTGERVETTIETTKTVDNKTIKNTQKYDNGKKAPKTESGTTTTTETTKDKTTEQETVSLHGLDISELDENEEVLYFIEDGIIRAPQSRQRFPSSLQTTGRYILVSKNYSAADQMELYKLALADLKANCVPKVTYEINGYSDSGIGDEVTIIDDDYNPPLYLDARVTERVTSFTDPVSNKTTYSNVIELASQIDKSLLARMQEMINANKQYTLSVTTSAGTVFRNGKGQTTLKAYIYDKDIDITESCAIRWYKGESDEAGTGRSIDITAGDVGERLSYRFEAFLGDKYIGMYEVTLVNISDGTKLVARTAYYALSNSQVIPTSGWSTNVLKPTAENKYLWNYYKLEYSDGSTEETDKVIIGTFGEKGDKGKSVVSITTEYYLSSSKTECSGGSWVTEIPERSPGKYLFSRTKTVFENPSDVEYSEPVYDSRWEKIDEAIAKAEDNATQQAIEVEQRLSSQITKADAEIRMSVSEQYVNKNDFSDLRSQMDTRFIQTSNSFEMQFNEMMKSLSASDQSTADKFTEITKYIRFENGNIILGQKGNQLECKITNDRLSFYQSGHEVAYVSNNKLYVTDGEFMHSLRIGKFAFVPRANGSLDFKKVG